MSTLSEAIQDDDLDFQWKKKRGVGKNKDIQFYESFMLDGMEYSLYDDIYLCKDDITGPYIGKLIKIWEMPDKAKRVKILWFFRPSEISNWLKEKTDDRELFLASGEGKGLTNINPLEAICGKCNVVCTSKDSRNVQLSSKDVEKADYFFSRTFNVGSCEIMNKIPEVILGIEAKFLLNRKDQMASSSMLPLDRDVKGRGNDIVTCKGPSQKKVFDESPAAGKDVLLVGTDVSEKGLSTSGRPDSFSGTYNTNNNAEVKTVLSSKRLVEQNFREIGKACEDIPTGKALEKNASCSKECSDLEFDDRSSKKPKIESSSDENEARIPVEDGAVKQKAEASMNLSEVNGKTGLGLNGVSISELDPPFGDKVKPENFADSALPLHELSQKLKPNRSMVPPDATSRKISLKDDKTIKEGELIEVTRRPKVASGGNKWFREPSWDDKLRTGLHQETVILLQNLDPSYTSAEVEDIVWHAFREPCTSKMVQRVAISSPHTGEALVVFKTKEAADDVLQKLEDGCLMLSNGRPLVGSTVDITMPGKFDRPPPLLGHLSIDKLKIMQRADQKDAVSTSHCSQPNTIEYEMAMEWCLLQARSDSWWKKLYKEQGRELNKVKAEMISK